MKERKLNITISLEDNDLVQFNLEKLLKKTIGERNITNMKVLPNTDELYDSDPVFRSLIKKEKKAKDEVRKWINDHNI